MTIDEAIEMYKKIANTDSNCPRYCMNNCEKCVKECKQVAEWLEELKNYRDKNKMVIRIDCTNSEKFNDIAVKLAKEQYNKAIDDIKEKLMKNGFIYTQHALDVFNELSEQLKEGGEQTDDN